MDTVVKNVGKLLILVTLWLTHHTHAASIALHLFDTQGVELSSVGIGQPFILKVAMEGFRRKDNTLSIPDLDKINAHYRGEGYNSLLQSYVTYSARIDTKGTYTIGPARREHEGAIITSPPLSIVVNDAHVPLHAPKKNSKKALFARFFVDNTHVVINQAIACTVRFYYTSASGVTGEAQLNTPQLPGFVFDNVTYTGTGEEKTQDATYHYLEWQWHLYPQEAGSKLIPAFAIDFAKQTVARNSFFGLTYQNVQRIHTNSVHLTIDPLPPHDTPITAVGTFSKLTMSLAPSTIQAGEAAILTIEIHGHGNGALLPSFPLSHTPDALKCYESKTYIRTPEHSNELPKKCFEFVIQGLKAGTWEIPAQTFTFFDTERKEYKTLEAPALPITVTAAPVAHKNELQEMAPATPPENNADVTESPPSQLPLPTDTPWYNTRSRTPLPFWLFMLALSIPLLYGTCVMVLQSIRAFYRTHEQTITAKRAFAAARIHARRCAESRTPESLYNLFIRLIAQKCIVPETMVTRHWVQTLLHDKKCSSSDIAKWDEFFDLISHFSFAKTDTHYQHTTQQNTLYAQVEYWIAWLEKVL